ncbi:MAG: hypothetical protein UY72_C0057G0003 [Candidatus Uhrbacteria bacterium GW2011_GWD2_52_7]|uniref:Uncharacterized protein n=1 Tax=Candidatus Uhrbacteria bacterium GW2011_GWD2_52_7 TaxID=1618989 RepID=A0A0G2A9C5_9BACT|nr:MAG: hypothetical protein UY72_C0057G0003 [Candidatus Uhrbacteria bacterium GW2011_GWD2_52_7]
MPVPFKDLQPEWQQYITRLVEEKADMTLMSYSLAVVCITLLVIFVWLAAVYVTNNKRANETKKMAEDRRVAYVYMLDMIVAGGRVDREGLEKVIIEHFSGDACLVDDMLLVSTNSGALTIADNKRRHIFTSVAEKLGFNSFAE